MKKSAYIVLILIILISSCTNIDDKTGATVIEKTEILKSACDGVNVCVDGNCKFEEDTNSCDGP